MKTNVTDGRCSVITKTKRRISRRRMSESKIKRDDARGVKIVNVWAFWDEVLASAFAAIPVAAVFAVVCADGGDCF